ncbi:hypothetical protein [Bosea sp. 685]|uniref:hypothetical protein n=1 Tax=Bosea sp. 685 TaxID=3080057 RepID=UPI0028932B49|nr:hypothetical protein [Bosea sp. 685]WNJ87931.1 hypothetical protein RMR04_00830 [Bosea sp. 685]
MSGFDLWVALLAAVRFLALIVRYGFGRIADVSTRWATGDYDMAHVTIGQAIGLIHDVPPAAETVWRTVKEATTLVKRYGARG